MGFRAALRNMTLSFLYILKWAYRSGQLAGDTMWHEGMTPTMCSGSEGARKRLRFTVASRCACSAAFESRRAENAGTGRGFSRRFQPKRPAALAVSSAGLDASASIYVDL